MQHVRVPGMLHGRVVRPRGQRMYGAGAKIMSVDEASIRAIPGARVVRKGDFLGVVAENEWDAVRAAQQLKVVWETPPALPGNAGLYEHMRAAKTDENVVLERGNVTAGFSGAAHTVSHTCLGPYQAHAPFGPNCALADVKADSALVMCSTQDVYGTRNSLSRLLGMPVDKVRVQYYEGSGTYGHSCYDDVAQAAVLLSQLAGKPVRLQFMRWDEHGWDNYGPAHVGEVRAAADANGKIVAYEYQGWQHGWSNVETSEQLHSACRRRNGRAQDRACKVSTALTCGGMYDIPNLRLVNHKLPVTSYLQGADGCARRSIFRSRSRPNRPSISWRISREIDPYEFRQRNMTDTRWLGVLDAAAQAAKWTPRKAAANLSRANIVTGRGIGVGTHLASYGAAVAEIEVNKETGRVVAKHLYGAIDAGLVVNPGIRRKPDHAGSWCRPPAACSRRK